MSAIFRVVFIPLGGIFVFMATQPVGNSPAFQAFGGTMIFLLGGLFGYGLAQDSYRKLLDNYRGYCAEYRAMLDRRLKP